MAGIKDLEQCNYFPLDGTSLIAVGWLSAEIDFQKGKCEKLFYEKLKELCKNPLQPVASAGVHHCELCQFDPPAFSNNLFLPYSGKIFVAPVAIVHYIAQHNYLPPSIFIEAVMASPKMQSMEFKKLFVKCGGGKLLHI
jgi:hypothetical protein